MEARLVERNDPQVPKCELWVAAYLDKEFGWEVSPWRTEAECDADIRSVQKHGYPARKFHLTDEPNVELEQLVETLRGADMTDDERIREAYRAGLRAKGGEKG